MSLVARAARHILSTPAMFSRHVLRLPLRQYQLEPVRAVLESILNKRGYEFVWMFPRQSGKNESVAQMCVYLLNILQRTGGNLWLGFSRLCLFCDIPVFRFHAVRKRGITDIIQTTGDQRMGQLYANHRSPYVTQTYYNDIQAQRVDEVASQLSQKRRSSNNDLASELFKTLIR